MTKLSKPLLPDVEQLKIDGLKKALFDYCMQYADMRMATAQQAMTAAQAAANEEGKSSAGDKYETGRAMMQIERDQAAQQLDEALKLRNVLMLLKANNKSSSGPGKVIVTSIGNFFIAISAGNCTIDNQSYLTVSTHSPIGKILSDAKPGQLVRFNGKDIRVHSIE
jgi:hypothetical protein